MVEYIPMMVDPCICHVLQMGAGRARDAFECRNAPGSCLPPPSPEHYLSQPARRCAWREGIVCPADGLVSGTLLPAS